MVSAFQVEKVIFNCGSYNALEQELIQVLEQKKINYDSCITKIDTVSNPFYFLQTREYDNENDNSNILYTEIQNYTFLFMGDASSTVEKEILSHYRLSSIDFLKVGHHGSRTSSSKAFIQEITPKYAIISVGENNRYGHPNQEVLESFRNSQIYRTDREGTIEIIINKGKYKVKTYRP